MASVWTEMTTYVNREYNSGVTVYSIHDLNPEPWSVSVKVKRGALQAYQNAIKEELEDAELWPVGVPIKLTFHFWRQLESEVDTDGRVHKGQIADATNLQKALEDALQGVLFSNDRYVTDIRTVIEAQGPSITPLIEIIIERGVER